MLLHSQFRLPHEEWNKSSQATLTKVYLKCQALPKQNPSSSSLKLFDSLKKNILIEAVKSTVHGATALQIFTDTYLTCSGEVRVFHSCKTVTQLTTT